MLVATCRLRSMGRRECVDSILAGFRGVLLPRRNKRGRATQHHTGTPHAIGYGFTVELVLVPVPGDSGTHRLSLHFTFL